MCPVVFLAMGFSLIMLLLEITAAVQPTLVCKDPPVLSYSPIAVNRLKEGDFQVVNFNVSSTCDDLISTSFFSEDPNVLEITNGSQWYFNDSGGDGKWTGSFMIKGLFLGFSDVKAVHYVNQTGKQSSAEKLSVSVIRNNSVLSTVFVVSIAVLVSLNYINMGCALDFSVIKPVLKRPISPVLGFLCQYLVMPLVAYGVGKALFSDHNLRLGLFVFGCSPGGGASNMWTLLLGGNLNLSITLTFISTSFALLMMPFWLFTLGSGLFESSISVIPFKNILLSLVSMVVPLGIGLLIQRYQPKVANFCKRIVAPVSIVMIIYIIIFGTVSNLYMFKLMSWKVLLAASLNVWIGFLAGVIVGSVFRQSVEDMIALAIETGVQNSGIAIVLLGFSLGQPAADLASVVPVAASIVTPIPLLVVLICKKIYKCCTPEEKRYVIEEEDGKKMVLSASDHSSIMDDKSQINGLANHTLK